MCGWQRDQTGVEEVLVRRGGVRLMPAEYQVCGAWK